MPRHVGKISIKPAKKALAPKKTSSFKEPTANKLGDLMPKAKKK